MDLRTPIGVLFSLLGVLLAAHGWWTRQLVLDINVNLLWGFVLLAFGVAMLALGYYAKPKTKAEHGEAR
jgi:hypothetical protein